MFVLLCAFLTGFLWRLRGDHGWGGMAGMTAVAVGFILALCTYLPYRKKANAEIFIPAVFFTAITNSGWGTLNSQITGILGSGTDAPGVAVSPLSGAAVMIMLGFGWMPFLGLFIGLYLSEKKPKHYHIIIAAVVYFAVEYIAKATVSHLAVKLICPQAVDSFAETLGASGIELSPFKAYLAHYNDISWAKKLAFGRNYFQTVETASQFFASLSVIIYAFFALKDKTAAKVQFLVCAASGAAITIADLFIFFADGGVRNSIKNVPEWLSGWSNWEYWTGFLAGLLIAIICVGYVKKHPAQDTATPAHLLPDNKYFIFIRNYALLAFPAIVAAAVPLAKRLTYENDFFFRGIDFSDKEILVLPFILITAAALILPAVKMTRRELETKDDGFFLYSRLLLTAFFGIFAILYFLTGNAYILNGVFTDVQITMYVSVAVITLLLSRLNKSLG